MLPSVKFGLLIAILLCGGYRDLAEEVPLRSRVALDAYHSSDVDAAEREVLEFIEFIGKCRVEQPDNADYDTMEGVLHLRLYSLYEYTGKIDGAERSFLMARELLRGRLPGLEEQEVSARLRTFLDGMEADARPKWKR